MALATTVMAGPIVNRLVSRDKLIGALIGGDEATIRPTARVLVALGNPLNAPNLVDVALRMTGGRRPAELLLVRLIPSSRAPEFSTGLLDVESQVAAAVDSMRPLVEQAAAAGVLARPISFLTDDVGPDLARIAADQKCDSILLGWHRASLARHIIKALVHKTFQLAPCDVAVLVDREGRGIVPKGDRPVAVVLNEGPGELATVRLGLDLATSLATGIRLIGYLDDQTGRKGTAASEALAHQADALRQKSGLWVVPVYAGGDGRALVASELADAPVAVIPVGPDWASRRDFGHPTETIAEEAGCPLLVVRPALDVVASHATEGVAHHEARPAVI